MKLDDYTLLKTIGKGAFGEVYLTSKEGTNQLFATKKVPKQKADSPSIKKYFINEISILRVIKHKNIIHFEAIKHTIHNYYIITEFCNGGGLSDCLEEYKKKYGKPFSEQIVQHLMRQIVDALKYLHGKRILHRDIKLDNILVNFENKDDKKNLNMLKAQIKIIDFGFATFLGKEDLTYSTLGSPINMDPLLLKKLIARNSTANTLGYDEKADIWSLGTVCYEMLIGQGVFNAENMKDLIKKVELGTYHIPTNLSKEVVSFLNGMLQYNAKNRLSAEELSRHHFLTKNIKDFKNIDLKKVSNRIDNKGLNINIKKNQSIWAIFKEEDEKALIDIPGKYLMEKKPIEEQKELKTLKEKNDCPFKKENNDNNINKNVKENNNINKKINVNININNKQIQKPKEKEIDYDLLKKQQKLYYQLNRQNNNYKRFANYAYNNPYGFGGIYNNQNYNNYFPNGQPIYYNANLNPNVKINNQVKVPAQASSSNKNIIVQAPLSNQIYPQNQYNQGGQPKYIIKDNEIIPNPALTQNQQQIIPQKNIVHNPQAQLQNKNIQVQNHMNIPDNNKQFINNKNTQTKEIKISNGPKGSRMPQKENYYANQTKKNTLLENQKQNNKNQNKEHLQDINYNIKNQNKDQLQNINYNIKNQNKDHLQDINYNPKNQNQNTITQKIQNEKQIPLKTKKSNDINQEVVQQPKLQKKISNNINNPKNTNKNEIMDKIQNHGPSKSKETENNNEDKGHNKIKSHSDLYSNSEEPKNNPRHYINKNENSKKHNDDETKFLHKNSDRIQVKKIENHLDKKLSKDEDKLEFPFDDENNNNNKLEKKAKTFNEPLPIPEDNDAIEEKVSDELNNLIDFKLGDELCLEPESLIENEKEDNNLDSPMKKIMDHTVERPTIGVPSPGTDPNDNFSNDDDYNNGVFQSNHKKEFDIDDFEEI